MSSEPVIPSKIVAPAPSGEAPTVAAVLDRLRAWRKACGWSVQRLAREAGLGGHETIRQMDAEDWRPTTRTITAIESVIPAGWRPGDPVPTDSGEAA